MGVLKIFVGGQFVDIPIVSDHGALTGLSDVADHPGFLVIDGTRPLTGDQTTQNLIFATGKAIQTSESAGNTLLLQAFDVDGSAYVTFATLTANDTPTMDLSDAVTHDGNSIITGAGEGLTKSDNALSTTNAFAVLGFLGTTETIDYDTNSNFKGILNSNVTITISNISDGQYGSLSLAFNSSAKTIAWIGVDKWFGGQEPLVGPGSGQILFITFVNDGDTIMGVAEYAE